MDRNPLLKGAAPSALLGDSGPFSRRSTLRCREVRAESDARAMTVAAALFVSLTVLLRLGVLDLDGNSMARLLLAGMAAAVCLVASRIYGHLYRARGGMYAQGLPVAGPAHKYVTAGIPAHITHSHSHSSFRPSTLAGPDMPRYESARACPISTTSWSLGSSGKPRVHRLSAEAEAAGTSTAPSCGAPGQMPTSATFTTAGGMVVTRTVTPLSPSEFQTQYTSLIGSLDDHRGCVFESSYEYPGRYAQWSMGFNNPPLVVEGQQRSFEVRALNSRGNALLPIVEAALGGEGHIESLSNDGGGLLRGTVCELEGAFQEEQRSKQPSIFSVVRSIVQLFEVDPGTDEQLGLYGSFGYDLGFQFEPVKLARPRRDDQRDLALYLPDSFIVRDARARQSWRVEYDFAVAAPSAASEPTPLTQGLDRTGLAEPFVPDMSVVRSGDHAQGQYAKKVERAKEEFIVGNLFEAVLSQVFYEPNNAPPSELFDRLRERNPSPYMFVMNLGKEEWLVGASPEMFVRVETTTGGQRVETCPISGTIRRGANALEDAVRVKEILNSAKEESELTMCTDVDRNDKSRVCKPGSVRVVGRRQIEMYSALIHTVDHVEGYLEDGYDALDAFLVHTWAVTVTGAPKAWAMQFVEDQEETPRDWYGGAVGLMGFDGHMNTGLTLRTIHLNKGRASVRAGATLLYDSDPLLEEKETELKASAFRDALLRPSGPASSTGASAAGVVSTAPKAGLMAGSGKRVLLVDHQDSFVHTLANYLRQTGAAVDTIRCPRGGGIPADQISRWKPDLVVLSPGPGNPSDFGLSTTIAACVELEVPIFGVCLGLQGIVEHFGGELAVLGYPMHGKPSPIQRCDSEHPSGEPPMSPLGGLPSSFVVARYHSLYAKPQTLPSCLEVMAETVEGQGEDDTRVVMAVAHKSLPIAAVQFHPESIITNPSYGLAILSNALEAVQ